MRPCPETYANITTTQGHQNKSFGACSAVSSNDEVKLSRIKSSLTRMRGEIEDYCTTRSEALPLPSRGLHARNLLGSAAKRSDLVHISHNRTILYRFASAIGSTQSDFKPSAQRGGLNESSEVVHSLSLPPQAGPVSHKLASIVR